MERLVAMASELYGGKAQLRTLQRRMKARLSACVTEMVLGGLRKADGVPTKVRKQSINLRDADRGGRFAAGRPWTCGRCACGTPAATMHSASLR
jgi:hypothetical protein